MPVVPFLENTALRLELLLSLSSVTSKSVLVTSPVVVLLMVNAVL